MQGPVTPGVVCCPGTADGLPHIPALRDDAVVGAYGRQGRFLDPPSFQSGPDLSIRRRLP